MRKSGSEPGELAGHRLQPSSLFSPRRRREDSARWRAASGGATNTSAGLSTDRDGTDDDHGEGGFSHAFPP
jgi:hypothetical protein